MIVLGSHMPNMNYEVYCGSASVELTQYCKQRRHWIIGTFIMILVISYTGAKKGSCFKFLRVPLYLMQYGLLSILTPF